MTYYNVNKIKDIIKMYSHYHLAISKYRPEYQSVGVTVYSEEAAMPRANKISDTTANEALRHESMSKVASDIKYVRDRLYRVPKHLEELLDLRLSGHSVKEIYEITNKSQSTIYRELNQIAKYILGEI